MCFIDFFKGIGSLGVILIACCIVVFVVGFIVWVISADFEWYGICDFLEICCEKVLFRVFWISVLAAVISAIVILINKAYCGTL